MLEYSLQARAKVNLTMDVLRRRPDGYHEVDLLMQSVSLCDTLMRALSRARGCIWSSASRWRRVLAAAARTRRRR